MLPKMGDMTSSCIPFPSAAKIRDHYCCLSGKRHDDAARGAHITDRGGDYRNVVLNWVNPDSVDLAQINVYASKTNKLDTATLIAQAATTTFTHAGLGDNETGITGFVR